MASLKQIAKETGVSVATVSNVLSGKGRVSHDVARRVRDYAERVGYVPSQAARALKTGQSNVLGLVMPDLTNPLFPQIAQNLSIAAEQRGLGILIGDSRGDAKRQAEAISWLSQRGVDGLIVVPQKGTAPAQPPGTPMVIINTGSDPRSAVAADHVGGGRLLGQHIAGLGHRQIILLGADPISDVQQDRIRGMRAGLGDGVTVQTIWGSDAFAQLPDRIARGFTAVMTTSDLLALRVHSCLTQAGFSVPADVSLTGFDDLPLGMAMFPKLTTVAQNMEQIADHAVTLLTAQIAGLPPPSFERAVPMRMVLRGSAVASTSNSADLRPDRPPVNSPDQQGVA